MVPLKSSWQSGTAQRRLHSNHLLLGHMVCKGLSLQLALPCLLVVQMSQTLVPCSSHALRLGSSQLRLLLLLHSHLLHFLHLDPLAISFLLLETSNASLPHHLPSKMNLLPA